MNIDEQKGRHSILERDKTIKPKIIQTERSLGALYKADISFFSTLFRSKRNERNLGEVLWGKQAGRHEFGIDFRKEHLTEGVRMAYG